MAALKQSTTFTRMFLMVQTSDHLTGLTGASPTVTISKAGGAFGAAAGTVTEVASGWYKIALTTGDTATLGDLAYHITAASGDPTDFADQVTSAVDQTGDNFARLGAPAGASIAADVAAVKTDTAAVKVQTDKLAFTVTNQIDANVLDWKSATAPAMTGDAYARLGAPSGASVGADIAAVKTDTAAVKVQTDKFAFTVANQVDSNVIDWKSATAPAMTGDAFARLGAPAGASVSADVAAVNSKTTNLPASPAAVGSAMALTSGERNSVADAMLDRDMSTGTDSGSTTVRTARQALRFLRNKFAIAAGTLTVYKEDDATSSWTAAVTTTAGNPVSASDPAGP